MEVLFWAVSHLGSGLRALLGFSRPERITHSFIRNLLKTDRNMDATLTAHHHIAFRDDRLDGRIYP